MFDKNEAPHPKGYSPTDKPEREALSLVDSILIRHSLKPHLSQGDKTPNHDGYIEIVDEKNVPTGQVWAQVRAIRGVKYRCPVELPAFARIAMGPFLLICADLDQRHVYWRQLSSKDIENIKHEKTFGIKFGTDDLLDDHGGYVAKWKLLVSDHQTRLHGPIPLIDREIFDEKKRRRLEVFQGLKEVHHELASLYEGARRVLDDPGNRSRGYQAAHNLHEIMKRLPEYLLDADLGERRLNLGHLFGCDPDGPIVDQWCVVQDELHKWAHLRGRQGEKDDPGEVEKLAQRCDDRLWGHLGSYTDATNEIDSLLCEESPSQDQIKRAMTLISSSRRRKYLFDTLNHQSWLPHFRQNGFFRKPPLERYWPESGYLARMTAKDTSLVCDIFLNDVPDTANPTIYLDLLDAAVAMPPNESMRLQNKICNDSMKRLPFSAPEKFVQIIESWAKAGFQSDAHNLARFLFNVSSAEFGSSDAAKRPHPIIRIDPRDYRLCLGKYTTMNGASPPEGVVTFLITLLRDALSYSDRTSPEDLSCIWRSSIPDDDHDFGHDQPLHILISCLRDTAILYAKSCPSDELPSLFEKLEREAWHIFERISLHVMAQVPNRCVNLLAGRILDMSRYDNMNFRYEYFQLVKHGFSFLNQDDQRSFLNLIEGGPQNGR